MNDIWPALSGAGAVWLLMVYAKVWSITYADKSMFEEVVDRMQYLTGHMK